MFFFVVVVLVFLAPLEMMRHSTVFELLVEKLIEERENLEFFSGFSFSPVTPSLLAVRLEKRADI